MFCFFVSFFFVAADMDHWCRVSELDHLPFDVQKEIAIPTESDDGEEVYSSCSYYQQNYTNFSLGDWERSRRNIILNYFFTTI